MQFHVDAIVHAAEEFNVTVFTAVGKTPQVGLFVPAPEAGEQNTAAAVEGTPVHVLAALAAAVHVNEAIVHAPIALKAIPVTALL